MFVACAEADPPPTWIEKVSSSDSPQQLAIEDVLGYPTGGDPFGYGFAIPKESLDNKLRN